VRELLALLALEPGRCCRRSGWSTGCGAQARAPGYLLAVDFGTALPAFVAGLTALGACPGSEVAGVLERARLALGEDQYREVWARGSALTRESLPALILSPASS